MDFINILILNLLASYILYLLLRFLGVIEVIENKETKQHLKKEPLKISAIERELERELETIENKYKKIYATCSSEDQQKQARYKYNADVRNKIKEFADLI